MTEFSGPVRGRCDLSTISQSRFVVRGYLHRLGKLRHAHGRGACHYLDEREANLLFKVHVLLDSRFMYLGVLCYYVMRARLFHQSLPAPSLS